jgi:hypothetical protein
MPNTKSEVLLLPIPDPGVTSDDSSEAKAIDNIISGTDQASPNSIKHIQYQSQIVGTDPKQILHIIIEEKLDRSSTCEFFTVSKSAEQYVLVVQ